MFFVVGRQVRRLRETVNGLRCCSGGTAARESQADQAGEKSRPGESAIYRVEIVVIHGQEFTCDCDRIAFCKKKLFGFQEFFFLWERRSAFYQSCPGKNKVGLARRLEIHAGTGAKAGTSVQRYASIDRSTSCLSSFNNKRITQSDMFVLLLFFKFKNCIKTRIL